MTENELKELILKFDNENSLNKAILDVKSQQNPSTPINVKDTLDKVELISKLRDFKFAEFNDREFADWKRVRASIEHENTLINHRLTWLFSSQAFLITSYTLAFIQWSKKENLEEAQNIFPALLLVIAFFAIVLCFFIWFPLTAARFQLLSLDDWWHDKFKGTTKDEKREDARKKHPPLQGWRRRPFLEMVINTETIPILFIITWICLVVFSIAVRFVQIGNTISEYWNQILLVLGLAILLVSIFLNIRYWIRRKP